MGFLVEITFKRDKGFHTVNKRHAELLKQTILRGLWKIIKDEKTYHFRP